MAMEYLEIKQIFKGYAEYMALEYGTDIKFRRSKIFNEFEYWTKQLGEDLKIFSVEVGSVKNGIVMKFNHSAEFLSDFLEKYKGLGGYSYVYNVIMITAYDVEKIHELMNIFCEIGYFMPRN